MGKSTEGVVLIDGQIKSLSDALTQLDISSAVNEREIEVRSQFVQYLKKAIGDLANPQMPIGIKLTLQRLIQESDYYIEHGNENAFVRLCHDAIDVCRQGWSILSYFSTEQNICYSIHWSLKEAIDKHKKEMLKVRAEQSYSSKNDPVSSVIDNPNATRKEPGFDNKEGKYSFPLFNTSFKEKAASAVRVLQDPSASYKNKS